MKSEIKDIIGMSIFVFVFLLIIFGLIFFLGGTILFILGLRYDSLWILAKFFIIYMIIAMPLDFIIECLLKVIKNIIGLKEIEYAIIYSLIDILINTVLIGILEWFIDGIECSLFTALLFSTIFCVLSYFFDKGLNYDKDV